MHMLAIRFPLEEEQRMENKISQHSVSFQSTKRLNEMLQYTEHKSAKWKEI